MCLSTFVRHITFHFGHSANLCNARKRPQGDSMAQHCSGGAWERSVKPRNRFLCLVFEPFLGERFLKENRSCPLMTLSCLLFFPCHALMERAHPTEAKAFRVQNRGFRIRQDCFALMAFSFLLSELWRGRKKPTKDQDLSWAQSRAPAMLTADSMSALTPSEHSRHSPTRGTLLGCHYVDTVIT